MKSKRENAKTDPNTALLERCPGSNAKLASILTYHVVAGKVIAGDVKTKKAKTGNGRSFDAKVTDGTVAADNSKVVKTGRHQHGGFAELNAPARVGGIRLSAPPSPKFINSPKTT